MALDQHQKRSAASYNEVQFLAACSVRAVRRQPAYRPPSAQIGSFITHSVQKKIRTTLEPIPLLVAAQKIQQQQVQASALKQLEFKQCAACAVRRPAWNRLQLCNELVQRFLAAC